MKDYYKIAQVHPQAEMRVITKIRKVLATIYHPDNTSDELRKDEFTKKMQEINEALDILTDEDKRREYDELYHKDSKEDVNYDYGPTYKYRNQFDETLHAYLESNTIFWLSRKKLHSHIFDNFERNHLYKIATRIEDNRELTPWQKRTIVKFIAKARENDLLD